MAEQAMISEKPHVVLVPLMAQGHMIPMIDIAHILVDRGATVSYITTPANAARIRPVIDKASAAGLPISFITFNFPCAEVGMPEEWENVDQIPWSDDFTRFFKATSLLREPLELYLREAKRAPSCIIADYTLPWTMDVARKLNIRRLVFHGPSCFFILCCHRINVHRPHDGMGIFEPAALPDMPLEVCVTKAQAPGWFPSPELAHLGADAIEAEATADGVVVNTFYKLEKDMVDCYQSSIGKPVWAVGPLSLYDKDVTAARGKKTAVDGRKVSSWLDSKEPRSVVYVNFGSIVHMEPAQLMEVGGGLEAAGGPFVWVIKEAERCRELDEWMMGEGGFEERAEGRGLVITGWAPQMAILSHPAVGGFMTHCGWNSVLEAVSAKVPMVTWPSFSDQMLNQKLVVDVFKIGVSVGVEVLVWFAGLVKREQVATAIRRLMDGGGEVAAMRERIAELGVRARAAMEEGGSSYKDSCLLMEYIRQDST